MERVTTLKMPFSPSSQKTNAQLFQKQIVNSPFAPDCGYINAVPININKKDTLLIVFSQGYNVYINTGRNCQVDQHLATG